MYANEFYCLTHPHPLKHMAAGNHSWFCDISVQLKGCLSSLSSLNTSKGTHYKCNFVDCFYAICENCYEYYKCSQEEMPAQTPPYRSTIHSHDLDENIGKSWKCDGRKSYADFVFTHPDGPNTLRYSCRKCDFDLCKICFLCSFDIKDNVNKVLLKRNGKSKDKSKIKEYVHSETAKNLQKSNAIDDVDALKEQIKALEVENEQLKTEIKNIKALIFEIQEELQDFTNELNSELKGVLMQYAGSSLKALGGSSLSTLCDFMTIIPGIGQITSALKMVYNIIATPANLIKNKVKVDKVKKTIQKLESLNQKLKSIV